MKKKIIFILTVLLLLGVILFLILNCKNKNETIKPLDDGDNTSFDYKIINEVNKKYKQNYMISPLSMAYALSIVDIGASSNTKKEIDNLLGNYKLIKDLNIKDRINLANALFIKNKYKNDIRNSFINTIKDNYDSDVLFDDYETPDVINNWVKEKTYNMIPSIIDRLNDSFVLGIANAIAIDVEWERKFECQSTRSEDFTLKDKTKMKTAMMHSSNDVVYFESNDAKGIIKDYVSYDKKTGKQVYEKNDNTISLEYIAILPNDLDSYMKDFSKEKLNNTIKNKQTPNSDLKIYLALPKYTYDFNYKDFKKSLIDLGMRDAFNGDSAEFKNILEDKSKIEIYISDAIHKSHIELSENGTKAAAVTAFMMAETTAYNPKQPKIINITFDKPFIYIIKEKNSDNIWFFGTVYEPMKWENNKCETKKDVFE